MKKFNLEERIKNSKFNTFANFKYFIIAPAVILLVGLILLCTMGFNKSIDFTGGYVAKVYIGSEHTFEEGQDLIESVLTEHNIVASLYQKTEENEEDYITFKYKLSANLTDVQKENVNNEIVDDLFNVFGYDREDMQQNKYVVGNQKIDASLGKQALVNTFSVIVLASALMLLYFILRFGHQSAMTALLAVYHDLLVALSLTLVFRLEINMTFVSALVAIFVYSFVSNALFFARIKNNIEAKVSAKEIANKTVKEHLRFELILTWFTLIMLVLFSVVGVHSILPFTIVTILGVLASFYSTTFLAPTLWAFVYVPRKKKPKPENPSKEIV